IGADMTSAELQALLAQLGAPLLLEVITQLTAGTAVARAQPVDGITYAQKLEKREALIDWNGPAPKIARQVRGCNPWPVAQTLLQGEPLRIWQAQARLMRPAAMAPPGSVLALEDERLLVACGEGQLAIERLQCAGRRVVSAADFVHGHATDGLRFG
ncbi:MAG TPA: hypothetical protein VGN77_07230, partial [Steroidobacteraceae bacterium]|nr:hypothetical protein [Steroidobacteraceae bacterium]